MQFCGGMITLPRIATASGPKTPSLASTTAEFPMLGVVIRLQSHPAAIRASLIDLQQ
jgi:hypothetical protein